MSKVVGDLREWSVCWNIPGWRLQALRHATPCWTDLQPPWFYPLPRFKLEANTKCVRGPTKQFSGVPNSVLGDLGISNRMRSLRSGNRFNMLLLFARHICLLLLSFPTFNQNCLGNGKSAVARIARFSFTLSVEFTGFLCALPKFLTFYFPLFLPPGFLERGSKEKET